jgi:flagellar hook-length control protein FliK
MAAAHTEAAAATNGAVAAAATVPAATAPAAPKATHLKAAVATQTGTAASDGTDTTADTSDASATDVSTGIPANGAAQPTAAGGKAKADNGLVDAAKADASAGGAPASAANTSAQAHSTHPAGQPLPDTSDAGIQAAGTIQPQLHASATSVAHASTLTATAATGDAVPLSGLAMEIAVTARSGKSRFEIRLDPADLGRIDVRIDVDRNGHVTSHLMVEKAETLSMLRQDAPQLQRALDDAGFRTGDGGLQFSLRDQSSSGQNGDSGSGRNAHRLIVSEDDSIPAAVAGRTYGRMLGSSRGVDIKV